MARSSHAYPAFGPLPLPPAFAGPPWAAPRRCCRCSATSDCQRLLWVASDLPILTSSRATFRRWAAECPSRRAASRKLVRLSVVDVPDCEAALCSPALEDRSAALVAELSL